MPHPLQRVEGISKKQEFRSEHLYIIQYICQMQITELQKFLNIKKILTVLPLDNTLHRNQALL